MNEAHMAHEPAKSKHPHVCPVHRAGHLESRLRYWIHDPRKLFGPFVRPGMVVLDVGCGPGFATETLSDLVGPEGRVIAADLQPEMLARVRARVEKAGIGARVRLHQCDARAIGLELEAGEKLGFAVAFFMAHEVPDLRAFFAEIHGLLGPGGGLFVAEPIIHVSKRAFAAEVATAEAVGFTVGARPKVRLARAVVLTRAR